MKAKGSITYIKSINSNGSYQFNGLKQELEIADENRLFISADYNVTISATSPTNTTLMDATKTPRQRHYEMLETEQLNK